MITDNQAKILIQDHLADTILRLDTAMLMNKISIQTHIIADYEKVRTNNALEITKLLSVETAQNKVILKLDAANTRWKRLAAVQLGAFVVSLGVIFTVLLIK